MTAERDIQRSILLVPDRTHIVHTQPVGFSSEETTDVGKDSFSHLIKPEDRQPEVMARR